MSMDFTRHDIEDAHLIVVVDPLGLFKWSTKRSNRAAAAGLRSVADDIEQSDHPRGGELSDDGLERACALAEKRLDAHRSVTVEEIVRAYLNLPATGSGQ